LDRRWIVLATLMPLSADPPERRIGFSTDRFNVEMTVGRTLRYRGAPLDFVREGRPGAAFCLTAGMCPTAFVGAVAAVRFRVSDASGGRVPLPGSLRERVTVLAQSDVLAPRLPFLQTQRLDKGAASDIQAFGYDEAAVPLAERARLRRESAGWWRRFRQELFVDGDEQPFAWVEWQHTLSAITVERAVSLNRPGP
jgi:hypothetical protein